MVRECAPDPSEAYDDDFACYPELWLFVASFDPAKGAAEAETLENISGAAEPSGPPSPMGPIAEKVVIYCRDTNEWVDVSVVGFHELGGGYGDRAIRLSKHCVLATARYDASKATMAATRVYLCGGQPDSSTACACQPMLNGNVTISTHSRYCVCVSRDVDVNVRPVTNK